MKTLSFGRNKFPSFFSLLLFLIMYNSQIVSAMKFELPKLTYAENSLEPVISARTMDFHYGKHHMTYVNNLNQLIIGTPFERMSLEEIIRESARIIAAGGNGHNNGHVTVDLAKATAIFNNAAQTWNHTFFFESLAPEAMRERGYSPDGGILGPCLNEPKGKVKEAILAQWGSMEAFKKEYIAAGTSLFGSGWIWLVKKQTATGMVLEIVKEPNAGNPLTKGMIPLLVVDVWEHAYYLDYQNRRSEYLTAICCVINWDKVEARFNAPH